MTRTCNRSSTTRTTGRLSRGRSTVQQVVKLTSDIEESFEACNKGGLVLVDLTAAYDTVWHRGLVLKLLRLVPDRYIVHLIANTLSSHRFVLKTNDGQTSCPRCLKNNVPQGSSLAAMLFNIYLSDIPQTTSRQYGYADDLALFFSDRRRYTVEEVPSKDTAKIANYLLKWRLKLSMAETTTTAFHLNNKEAKCQLAIKLHGTILPHNTHPTYLGVKLDRQLTFLQHLEGLSSKVEAQSNLLRCLTGTSWGASATTHRIGALANRVQHCRICYPSLGSQCTHKTIGHCSEQHSMNCHRSLAPYSNCSTAQASHQQSYGGKSLWIDLPVKLSPSVTIPCLATFLIYINSSTNAWCPGNRSLDMQQILLPPILTFNAHGMWNGSRFHAHPSSVCAQTSLSVQVHHYHANSGSP